MALLHQFIALAALAVVVFAPGAAVLILLRPLARFDTLISLATAPVITIVLAAPFAVVQLTQHIDGRTMAFAWGGVEVASLIACAGWLVYARPTLALAPALATLALAAVGFTIGGLLDGDALYHAMYAERLAHLPHPSFANTQMFRDGSPHEGYLVPAWHFLVAQSALLGHVGTLDVMRSGAGVVVPLAALAFAATARAALRVHWAAWLGGLGFVLVDLLLPSSVPMHGSSIAMWPGTVALWIALPLVLTAWFEASRRGGRRFLVIAVIASVAVVLLHVTYALWIGWFALAWILGALLERRILSSLPVAVVSMASVAAAMAAYTVLGHHVLRSVDHVTTGVNSEDRSFFAKLLIGHHGTRLAPEVFAANGWPTMLATLAAGGAAIFLRGRAAIQSSILVLLVVAASEIDALGTIVAKVAGLSHVVRLPQVLRVEFGLVVVAVALAAVVHAVIRCRRGWFALACISGAALTASTYAAWIWEPEASRFQGEQVGRTASLVLLVASIVFALAAVAIAAVRRYRPNLAMLDLEQLDPRAVLIAAVLLTATLLPVALPALDDLGPRLRQIDQPAESRDKVGRMSASVIAMIRAVPVGGLVLSSTIDSHAIPALASVYVWAYPAEHTANTVANRRDARIDDARAFTFGRRVPDSWRREVISRTHPDLVVMPTGSTGADFVEHDPGMFGPILRTRNFVAARVKV